MKFAPNRHILSAMRPHIRMVPADERPPMRTHVHPTAARIMALPDVEQRTDGWLAMRARILTASDVAAMLGDNPYESRARLMKKKLGLLPAFDNPAMAHGRLTEDAAVRAYSEHFGEVVSPKGLLLHPEHPDDIGASPDGVGMSSGFCLEIKCPMSRPIDAVPPQYIPQVQTQMQVMGCEACVFVQYKPETLWTRREFTAFLVHRDDAWWARVLPQILEFNREVRETREALARLPPSVAALAATPTPKRRRRGSAEAGVFADIDTMDTVCHVRVRAGHGHGGGYGGEEPEAGFDEGVPDWVAALRK